MSIGEDAKPIRVFVHLAKDFDARRWERRWAAGDLIGINDRMPYGYFWAEEDGCTIAYSHSQSKSKIGNLVGSLLKSVTGIDFVHVWQNRKEIYGCDVVWTHTEIQYLAVLFLFQILFWRRRPKLIAQSVWLFDRWHELTPARRWILGRLIAKADILTFLSTENLKAARAIFPNVRSEFVPFGINADKFAPAKEEIVHFPVHIFSLGNDPHRDWPALILAVKGLKDWELKIASRKVAANDIGSCSNVEILNITSNDQLLAAFDWADMVVVALKPNLHASGITVVQEAALRGVAVICTDTGGLRAYFSDEEVYYVSAGDPSEIQAAIRNLAADNRRRWKLAARAQERMMTGGLNSRSYARRHAELSRELMARQTPSRLAPNAGETEARQAAD
ncbi:MAG: glycosyltransferase family 4 protein [Beijerinckiaceae bacterium]|nr:glycosyltransferase family 4 protein [Beijerinckiaceae bacterium]